MKTTKKIVDAINSTAELVGNVELGLYNTVKPRGDRPLNLSELVMVLRLARDIESSILQRIDEIMEGK